MPNNRRRPPNPQHVPRINGRRPGPPPANKSRRPPPTPPHSDSGKGACALWVPAIPFVAVFLLLRDGVRLAKEKTPKPKKATVCWPCTMHRHALCYSKTCLCYRRGHC